MGTQQDYQSVKRIHKNYEIIYIYLTNKSKSHVVLRNNKNGTKISFYKFKFEITLSYYNFNSGKKKEIRGNAYNLYNYISTNGLWQFISSNTKCINSCFSLKQYSPNSNVIMCFVFFFFQL